MKKVWRYFFLLLSTSGSAQNLVLNPSFEDTVMCPDFPQPTINYALYWSSYGGTSDYFNSCASLFGVPSNFAGYQAPHTGSAYAGLLTWYVNAGSPIREYMGIQFTTPLLIGAKYFVSFFISNADSITYNSSSNNFGVRFSTVPFSYTNFPALNNSSHMQSPTVITDKINWTYISGSFVADSAYQYLILGNFYDDANTVIDSVPPYSGTGSYYYIDDVCVSADSIYNATWTGINDTEVEYGTVIFPNPAASCFSFYNKTGFENMMMIDLLGNVIKTVELNVGLNQIDVSENAAGIYLLVSDQKRYFKLIVQH